VEEKLTELHVRKVSSPFELAAARIVDGCLAAGRVHVSAADFRLARQFLAEGGWRLEDVVGARVRVVKRDGRARERYDELTREAIVMAALRMLVTRDS
jgi:hypothetical protein